MHGGMSDTDRLVPRLPSRWRWHFSDDQRHIELQYNKWRLFWRTIWYGEPLMQNRDEMLNVANTYAWAEHTLRDKI